MKTRTAARVALALCAAGAVSILPFTASADHVDVTDRNDTKGPFDVARVKVIEGRKPRYDVVMFPRWKVARVWDRSFALIYFDTLGGEAPDYYVMLRSDGREMRGLLYRDRRRKKDRIVSGAKTWKPGKRSVAVRVPLRRMKLPEQRLVYHWWVLTLHTGRKCKRVCFDRAPDNGKVTEPAPGAGQSPTPTPTVSVPTPTPSVSVDSDG